MTDIHVPAEKSGGTFAIGARVISAREVVTLDFIVDHEDAHTVVERVRLAPSALEPLYLELGALLQNRREDVP